MKVGGHGDVADAPVYAGEVDVAVRSQVLKEGGECSPLRASGPAVVMGADDRGGLGVRDGLADLAVDARKVDAGMRERGVTPDGAVAAKAVGE